MKVYLIGLFLGLISIKSYAFDNNNYKYENFLNASDRGVYLQKQIDSLDRFQQNRCEQVLKFKQIDNDSSVLHLQVLCKGFDNNLYLFLPKTVDKNFIVNTCKEAEIKSMKVKCGKSLKQ